MHGSTDSESGVMEDSQMAFSSHPPRSAILVGVVADSKSATRQRAIRNLEALASARWILDWGVVAYDDKGSTWAEVAAKAKMVGTSLWVQNGAMSSHRKFIGKHVYLWRFVRAATRRHKYLWQIDADISFANFDMQRFFSIWMCAFKGGPPTIAQPVVRQSAQHFWPSNLDWWRRIDLPDLSASRLP